MSLLFYICMTHIYKAKPMAGAKQSKKNAVNFKVNYVFHKKSNACFW